MKKQIYDEKNGLSYTLHGDYYLPDLEINEEEPAYGKIWNVAKAVSEKNTGVQGISIWY